METRAESNAPESSSARFSRLQQLADQHLTRITVLEAEGNRAAQMIVSQRKELKEAHETAQQKSALIDSFDT